MGVIIYPCKIQDKLSKMNSELEALMGKIVTASRVMEKNTYRGTKWYCMGKYERLHCFRTSTDFTILSVMG